MLPTFATDTVTVLRAPLAESRGAQVPDWSRASSHEVAGCLVTAGSSTETLDRREAVETTLSCLMPLGADVRAGDRVEWDGRAWQVDGEPEVWRLPAGGGHVRCRLTAWRG